MSVLLKESPLHGVVNDWGVFCLSEVPAVLY